MYSPSTLLNISMTDTKIASTSGPIIIPINPKSLIPPRMLKKITRTGIFVLLPMMIGLKMLSTRLIPNIPISARTTPFNNAPFIKRYTVAGTHTTDAPRSGMNEAMEVANPQKTGLEIPRK